MFYCCNKLTHATLVHYCLAFAWLKRFDTALFVYQKHQHAKKLKKAEELLIDSHNATNLFRGLNCRQENAK